MFFILSIFLIFIGFENAVATLTEEPKLVFFYGNNVNVNKTFELSDADQILQDPNFHGCRRTVLYIHGFVESPASATVQLITNAYITRGTYNILVLDWSALVNGSYFTAVNNTAEVGPVIASTLIDLFKKGLKRPLFHIVGHSLGGQLAGVIGRSVTRLSSNGTKLLRISGLDPAFPLFYPESGAPNGTVPINKNDADLVDVIHTDAGNFGAPVNTSCVDFIVNNETRFQPGCPVGTFPSLSPNDTCSHQRSVALWAESVSNPKPTFLSTNSDNPAIQINMGIDCPAFAKFIPGHFTVATNAQSPFSISSP